MRVVISLVLVVGVAALAGCGGSSASSKGKAFVVLVTDINQLNDHGFNQLAYQGLKRAEKDPG
jgi:basic membrane lipoprotein Med (substrate-binding protein (PBP1-ABC) superfamily)